MRVRPAAVILSFLLAAGCATAPRGQIDTLTEREREALLLMEMDRSKKREKSDLERLVSSARKEGEAYLAVRQKESRQRSIAIYRSLVDRYPGLTSDFMAESTFRLAELLFEEERERLREVLEKRGEGADVRPDFSAAIEIYHKVIDRFPGHPLAEDALYGLSYCYTEQGDPDNAAEGYSRLIERFPSTRYAVEIHMRLGEHYFSMENLPLAIKHYSYVVESGDVNYLDKALYKLGWCYYNLDRYDEAIDVFFALLDFDARNGGSTGGLTREAIEILARSFAEHGGTPALARQFARRGYFSYSAPLLLALADLYRDRSLYPEAIGTYRMFAETFPTNDALPTAVDHMRESYFIRGDTTAALQIMESLPEVLGPGSPWFKNAVEPRRLEVLRTLLEALESAALRRRGRAQAGGRESELGLALADLGWYERLSPDVPCRIAQLKGVIQSELSVFPDAALTLNSLAERQDCPEEAPLAALGSVAFQLQASESRGELDLPLLQKSVSLLKLRAPENPYTPKAMLALGEITLNSGALAAARSYFSAAIRDYPNSAEAVRSRMLIARTFFKENDYRQSAAWFKEAWRKSPDDEIGTEARKLHVFSLFKQAESLVETNRRTEAAEGFESIYRLFPDSEVAQISLYNAGKLYRAMGLEMKATGLFEELAAAYRDSDLASEALSMSVLILEALGDPVRAGQDSVLLAQRSTGEDRARSLVKAAELFTAGNAEARAASVRRAYLEEFQEPLDERARQTFLLGQNLERSGDWPSALAVYRRSVELAAASPDSQFATAFAARSQLRIAEESFARFRELPIGPPIEESVGMKRNLLGEVIRNFVAAGNYRTADVITASNHYIGSALELFKDSILTSPRPEGLDEAQLREYELLLEETAYPFEEQALKAYKVNIQRAVTLEILDPWIEKSYQRMAQLAPWAYEREEALAYPRTLVPPDAAALSPGPLPDLNSVASMIPPEPAAGEVKP